jgi:hypothetical protein
MSRNPTIFVRLRHGNPLTRNGIEQSLQGQPDFEIQGRTPGAFRSDPPVGGRAVTPSRAALASPPSQPGAGMSQQQFEAFMAAQIAAIGASGMDPETWIERHSTTFRAAWDNSQAMRLEK